ncbi:hypothetical protein [Streptomyces sp. Ncost-T10-10d]|uniref:hypothetical protein n=1 Tax=Streptomyces sp. Ncost-T10-10d TaxID=1839774 RepID=UPI00081D8ACA|nr:hypothetical protein [Streptomyces sp. Ncost-T10-10d]SCF97297.1 hypothetical protein GA0115254_1284105 [Streptomyces sp. Ncost-T10-10d]
MRLRSTVAAALGALALIVAVPSSADAASGDFSYTYSGLDGSPQVAFLIDPPSRVCITLPEVADPGSSSPAHSPRNNTDATAVVFTGVDCEGEFFLLRPNGGHASSRLKLRSVAFS